MQLHLPEVEKDQNHIVKKLEIHTSWMGESEGPGCPSGYDADLTNDGSIPVTTDFFLISCDSNQVPKWFGTHYNLEVSL